MSVTHMVLLWCGQSRGKKGLRRKSGIAKYFTIALRPWELSEVGHSGLQCLSRVIYGET